MLDIFILYLHLSGLNPDLNQTALFSWNQYSISIILNFSSDAEASEARTKVLASDADNVRRKIWWAQEDSNLRPHAYQACALTTWAMSPFLVSGFSSIPCTPSSSLRAWWRWGGSNSWPSACKADALPAELHPQISIKQIHLNGGHKWTRTIDLTLIRRAL